ncbi:PIN domain-like protein [Aureobasidium namibiae CBS 147.97]|uniref:PIN domain-like protein n=1 Tax=Aureobasidium namibiae CBS 147.97 TaxID=1043004 RepID=A0A074XA61_9PEZI|nr:PIN domain-like protein [Aureobasidium namibiae CBS 147.97]KEQ71516.1 PIN domain-like protein [Aureobasidium namibiae CBS 147.97]
MGVTGLWSVVQPCARPIKIETLNKKRLAVDASIWIYQFLKAVRDKDGNALRNSHVVGFFRRICKLLYFGIKPVFVFDGGAPALKRATINARKQRREGRREDATRTAGKLLALQMQRIAEEEENNRKRATHAAPPEEEEPLPNTLVYADEVFMTPQERQQNKTFKKKDQYHLPDLGAPLSEMGAPNDPRIMSLEELENYARQFDTGEDINVYDFSKIDFDGPFFLSLPPSDRYNILNAARLRSRLRMGYSKDQLDTMFPDRMAFSKFQIERVTERNDLTQRLMNLNGMNDDLMYGLDAPGRVAGERGREYVLVKNDGVEGGWALGVVTGKNDGVENKPIDVDAPEQDANEEQDEDEDNDFEDVPIEGLNRLPKATATQHEKTLGTEMARRRQAFYRSKRSAPRKRAKAPQSRRPAEAEGLFVEDDQDTAMEVDDEDGSASDDEELQRAIAMSMQNEDAEPEEGPAQEEEEKEDWLEKFKQSRADEGRPIPRGGGLAIAHIVNSRAGKAVQAAPAKSRNETASGPSAFGEGSDDSDDDMDFQAALAESRKSKYQSKQLPKTRPEPPVRSAPPKATPAPKNAGGFAGPLPFEKLDLGSSLLGKKKMQKAQEEMAGGFERDDAGPAKRDSSEPLPPWFDGDLGANIAKQKALERDDWQKTKAYNEEFQFAEVPPLGRRSSRDIIDLDLEESQPKVASQIIDISDEEEENVISPKPADTVSAEQPAMGDLADRVRAAPPTLTSSEKEQVKTSNVPVISRESPEAVTQNGTATVTEQPKKIAAPSKSNPFAAEEDDDDDEEMEWEQVDKQQTNLGKEPSVTVQPQVKEPSPNFTKQPTPESAREPTKSPSPDFENVDIPQEPEKIQAETPENHPTVDPAADVPGSVTGTADQNLPVDPEADEFGYYSDSEDDELLRQLATETEEHARFASTLNQKTQQQNVEDYERELKQLRTQQKKDRRDADEVTHVMIQECQQLLKLFGLPYITAPMEAEAQCAELVTLGLVDGIVTDDSDCFLFGGTRIYKNMFNQAKFVECYLTSDFEKEFDLTRQKMIGIAHLLGSDYTEGLPGVGPVTALEILSEFPNLIDFRDWYNAVQMNQIPKSEDATNPFRKKFRRQANKLFLPSNFPDPRVESAYLQPEVDSDPSAFQWGVPDLSALRSFLMATIGWNSERTDEVLVPVIKDMNRRQEEGTQANITAFFDGGIGAGAYAPRKRLEQGSKRMGSALDRMAKEAKKKRKGGVVEDGEEYTETAETEKPAPKKKAKRNSKRSAAATASADV